MRTLAKGESAQIPLQRLLSSQLMVRASRAATMRLGVAITSLAAVTLAAVTFWALSPLPRDLGPIVYDSREGLCSIGSFDNEQPICSRAALSDPSFSPDGQYLAASNKASAWNDFSSQPVKIVVTNRRGVTLSTLVGSEGFVRPVWSSEGSYIFAVSNDLPDSVGRWHWPSGKKSFIPVKGLGKDCGKLAALSFSPSGRRAAILCDFKHIYIAEVKTESFHVERKLLLSFSYVGLPKWLNDDRVLAIARSGTSSPANLWSVDTSLSTTQTVSPAGLQLRDYVAVSPNGDAVVVTATKSGSTRWSLWRISLSDGKLTQLTNGVEDTSPTWTR